MKKFLSVFLIAMMLITMLSVTALATAGNAVISPEKGNTEVEVQPSSPQTGGPNIVLFIAAAVVLLLVAVFAVKKLLVRA